MIVNNLLNNINKFVILGKDNIENTINYPRNTYELFSYETTFDKFTCLILFVIGFYILTKFEFKIKYIYYLILIFIVIKIIMEYNITNKITDDKSKSEKIKFINSYLFNDEDYEEYDKDRVIYNNINITYFKDFNNFIDFYWDTRSYITFTKLNFSNILQSTNNFLKTYINIKNNEGNLNTNRENAIKLFKETMNNFQSLIYSLPTDVKQNKLLTNNMKQLYDIFFNYIKDINLIWKNTYDDSNINNLSIPYETEIVYPANQDKPTTFDVF